MNMFPTWPKLHSLTFPDSLFSRAFRVTLEEEEREGGWGGSTTPSEQPSDEGKADAFDDEDIENSGS